jgi:NAD(P)-dependent dehydrogenase (short-subunit alcohol dehydrogenase family)
VQAAVDAFGGLDVLVNNASTAISGNIETLDDEGLMERLNGKTPAYMRCRRAALLRLRKSSRGRAICIGELRRPVPDWPNCRGDGHRADGAVPPLAACIGDHGPEHCHRRGLDARHVLLAGSGQEAPFDCNRHGRSAAVAAGRA